MEKVNFIKVSFHDIDFIVEIRTAFEAVRSNFNDWNNADEQTIQRVKESICTIAAAYKESIKLLKFGISDDNNFQKYKDYIDSKLIVEFSTKRPETGSLDVQLVYDLRMKQIYSPI